MNRFLLLILAILIVSCDIQRKEGQYIAFSDSMDVFCVDDSLNSQKIYNNDTKYKMLVFYDSLGCFDCKLKELIVWGNMIDYFSNEHPECSIVFVLSPKGKDYQHVRDFLAGYRFDYPIYLDSNSVFSDSNSFLYDKKYIQKTILLTSDNRVLNAKGNILRSRKDLKTIDNYLHSHKYENL